MSEQLAIAPLVAGPATPTGPVVLAAGERRLLVHALNLLRLANCRAVLERRLSAAEADRREQTIRAVADRLARP